MKKLLCILLFLPSIIMAQDIASDSVFVDLSNPRATLNTHLNFLQDDNYQPKKSAKTIRGLEQKKAVRKAIKIKQVLDGKGLYIDLNSIPTDEDYKDSVGINAYSKYIIFPNRLPEIYLEKKGNNWYYSEETVLKIDAIYNNVFPWYINWLQEIVPEYGHKGFFGIEIWQLVALLILLSLVILLYYFFRKIAFWLLKKIQHYITKSNADLEVDKVLKKLAHPISLLLSINLIDVVFPSLQFTLEVNRWVFLGLSIVETVFWIYVFLKLIKVVMKIYAEFTENTHSRLDDQLVPILNNFFTGLVLVLGFFRLLTIFGVDTTTLIAGATIGGLAFALASQDTVKNLIGTIMIFLDKPFHIDDWIEAGEVVGTVERVGFRSTRVRAADTSIYQIPNSKLSEIVINNKGLRLYRRYNTNLGLRYDTPPELIEAFVNGVRQIIIEHPETRSDSYNVEFTGFGDSALLIMVNVYFKSLAWSEEQTSKHRLHIAIIKLAAALGVEFAFPSTTVTIEQFPDKSNLSPKYNTSKESINATIQNILTEFKNDVPPENTPES
ncbi:mechanosensitive ion channel family protein [Polaribacter sp. MED152]|uniref:mechanosensitive ion channel family protein n=1 Tax=Polaribacter sp. MED152 TaxID=313598 RepID=UPI000186F4CB|nr:mechanosensitive ion channel family protein [Polaribacter sp. MED152]